MKKIEHYKNIIDQYLQNLFRNEGGKHTLFKPMSYSVNSPGKRIRGIINLMSANSLGGDFKDYLPLAAAIEIVHAFSLVHDDLPAIDNDKLRRGLPTTHVEYGEDIAILTGDALVVEAFKIISGMDFNPDTRVRLIYELADAIGAKGMTLGQALDVGNTDMIELDDIKEMYILKTGKLFSYSIASPSLLLEPEIFQDLKRIGALIGVAFQVTDDILDAVGKVEVTGKNSRSDQKLKKNTFVKMLGVKKAKLYTNEIYGQVKKELKTLPGNWKEVLEIIEYMEEREK